MPTVKNSTFDTLMNQQSLLFLDNVSLTIAGKTLLDQVSLQVSHNEIVTIVGPNGAGKSTLINVALKLKKPTSGTVKLKPRLRIGYVPQSINRDYTMPVSVRDFIRLTKARHKEATYQQTLEHLALSEMQNKLIGELSGGELRRVLFARALLNNPDLLVLDEPTAGVDVNGQKKFYQDLNGLREQYQFAVLMVSHDLHWVMSSTDRVICLNQHICCQGRPTQVVSDPGYLALFAKNDPAIPTEIAFYGHQHNHLHQ